MGTYEHGAFRWNTGEGSDKRNDYGNYLVKRT